MAQEGPHRDLQRVDAELNAVIAEAVEFADKSEEPKPEALFEDIYA